MNKVLLAFSISLIAFMCNASWFWPFGSGDEKKEPRVSELMEPASVLIDEASDLAEEGKISEAVVTYKKALVALDKIEAENPDRVESASFATVRNKRAYVNAAIDSLHLKEAKENARAVAVTDTTALEKKLAKKNGTLKEETPKEEAVKKEDVKKNLPKKEQPEKEEAKKAETPRQTPLLNDRQSRLKLAMKDIAAKDYDAAELTVEALLQEKANDASALNLRAIIELEKGELQAAEKTLDQAIQSNPRSYSAYYNMARLILKSRGAEGKTAAKRYYETGRSFGGPKNEKLESSL